MKINRAQAQEILNCSKDTVYALVAQGRLRDYATPAPGASKHEIKLDYDEVVKFSRTFTPPAPRARANGHATIDPNLHVDALRQEVLALGAKIDHAIGLLTDLVNALASK